VVTTAAVGGLIVLVSAVPSAAQHGAGLSRQTSGQSTALTPGAIHGTVRNEAGEPVPGVVVTAIGSSIRIEITDAEGRFEFAGLAPGPYMLRAHSQGYVAPVPARVDVRSNSRVLSTFAIRASSGAPVLLAGVGAVGAPQTSEPVSPSAETDEANRQDGELEWRMRYLRRGVLRETTDVLALEPAAPDDREPGLPIAALSRAVTAPARVATDFFTDTAFTGQIGLMTTGSFDAGPNELLLSDSLNNGVADVRLGAPVGIAGAWEVRGGITQADVSAWMVAGSYTSKTLSGHDRNIGVSFSAQQYDGRSPLTPPDQVGGTRNVGSVYAYDAVAISPDVSLRYGAQYARYDYLKTPDLWSPRVDVDATIADGLRIGGSMSVRALAPGAEEFLPASDTGLWLPPQRTFSALDPRQGLQAERGVHASVRMERDTERGTVGIRLFHERVASQLVTLFGSDLPGAPAARLGHYFVGNAGDATATGCTMEVRTALAAFARAAVAYTYARASLDPAADIQYLVLMAPASVRPETEGLHDLSARFEADVTETATRVVVLFRVGNGYAQPVTPGQGAQPARPDLDSRFDVQVRQALPFMQFSRARLEMLLAVRNFFREAGSDQSVYDERLAVQPPKRIVGGVTLHF
jgi:hypothetical protein